MNTPVGLALEGPTEVDSTETPASPSVPSKLETAMEPSENGAGIILFKKNAITHEPHYLLLKARWGRHWSVPKGQRNSSREGLLQAALRETREETGFEADQITLVDGFEETIRFDLPRKTRKCPDGIKRTRLFLGTTSAKRHSVRLSKEHTCYRWVPLVVAMRLLPLAFQAPLMRAEQVARRTNLRRPTV